jgi:ABC-type phosphate transport system substrate-binding protein
MKNNLMRVTLLISIAAAAFPLQASAGDYVVIVNKDNSAAADKAAVAKMFSGEMKSWGDGTAVKPVDLPEDNSVRASFTTEVVGKSVASMKAFWAQNVFSGKALPPKQMGSDDDVKKFVGSNKGAIGYIKPSSLDDSVRAVIK